MLRSIAFSFYLMGILLLCLSFSSEAYGVWGYYCVNCKAAAIPPNPKKPKGLPACAPVGGGCFGGCMCSKIAYSYAAVTCGCKPDPLAALAGIVSCPCL